MTRTPERVERQLRILYVCQHDFSGPSEKQLLGFAQELVERGNRVLFSLGGSAESALAENIDSASGIEVREHRLSGRRLRAADLGAAAAFAPTLIHAQNCRAPTAAAAADYARATQAPVFVHFEDDEWHAWKGIPGEGLYHRVGRVVRRVLSGRAPAGWPHSTRRSRAWARSNARALDALTPQLSAHVTARLGRPCATLLPVSPQVQNDHQHGFELSSELSQLPLAVVTGTIYPFSLTDTIQGLEAVAEVQRRGYRLGYVHPGNVHPRLDPVALAREAGLAPGTFAFPGLLPFADIGGLLQRASVLLQPGAPTEFNRLRLPSKLQAYLAAGRPTITFAAGFGELLEDREEVLKLYSGAPHELADRIEEVLDDPALDAKLSVGSQRAAARLFDRERNTDALISHYRTHVSAADRRRQ